MSSGSSNTSIYCGYDIPTESLGYPFNCNCNATIYADPDIAGPGVMTAFLFTGWFTFLVAVIPSWHRFLADLKKFNNRRKGRAPNENVQPPRPHQSADQPGTPPNASEGQSRTNTNEPRLKTAADKLLETLCDLQLATGTGILIAGLAQGENLNFYHEAIIASYWNLTLNSFWAAQLSNKKYKDIKDLPSFVRTSAIWCTVILSIFFQSRQTLHNYPRHGYWNPLDGDRCYRLNHDHSREGNAWLWIVGLSIYAFILSIRLLKHISTWYWKSIRKKDDPLERLQENKSDYLWLNWIFKWTWRIFSFDALDKWLVGEFKSDIDNWTPWKRRLYWVPEWILRILGFALANFLAIWSFGSASFGMETLGILGYVSWATLDIIDAKVSNQDLVNNEMSWGFGQILPMVLLGNITFSALDVYQDDKKREKAKKG
ncbi:hypothetical protein HOY82DRAFT_672276 [Tuber indicum]|nr:hypothetical protein HOY82DRAFT_672276 [Tuber indicum]